MNTQKAVVSRQQFQQTYLRSVEDVLRFWTPEMQTEISRHNVGWRNGRTDFGGYLRYSELRYWTAFHMVSRNGVIDTWCDIGGFSPLFAYLRQEGVEIIDHDPFENVFGFCASTPFDLRLLQVAVGTPNLHMLWNSICLHVFRVARPLVKRRGFNRYFGG